jgi:hypothetical protein
MTMRDTTGTTGTTGTITRPDLFTYTGADWGGADLTGFDCQALDGKIGTIDEATFETGASFLVVDTGPWIFGKKVMLPAGVIQSIDVDGRTCHVSLTKEQIQNAPEFDESRHTDPAYRNELGTYYGGFVHGRPGGPDFGLGDQPKKDF